MIKTGRQKLTKVAVLNTKAIDTAAATEVKIIEEIEPSNEIDFDAINDKFNNDDSKYLDSL